MTLKNRILSRSRKENTTNLESIRLFRDTTDNKLIFIFFPYAAKHRPGILHTQELLAMLIELEVFVIVVDLFLYGIF